MEAEQNRGRAALARRLAAWHAEQADAMAAEPERSSWRTRTIAEHRRAVREYERDAAGFEAAAAQEEAPCAPSN